MKLVIATLMMLLSTTAAHAVTYAGSLTAGDFTATYTLTTDGTIGVLSTANIISAEGAISDGISSVPFDGSIAEVFGNALTASASQIWFDTSKSGAVLIGTNQSPFPSFCLSGLGATRCRAESQPSLFVGQGIYFGQFAQQPISGMVLIGTAESGAVPEPASWAMLIAGCGLTGALLRRRREAASV